MAHDSSPDLGQRPPSSDDLEKVSVSWLILQRLSDLTESVATLRKEHAEGFSTLHKELTENINAVRKELAKSSNAVRTYMPQRFAAVDQPFESMERRWMWALGIMWVLALGLLAMLLLPGA